MRLSELRRTDRYIMLLDDVKSLFKGEEYIFYKIKYGDLKKLRVYKHSLLGYVLEDHAVRLWALRMKEKYHGNREV